MAESTPQVTQFAISKRVAFLSHSEPVLQSGGGKRREWTNNSLLNPNKTGVPGLTERVTVEQNARQLSRRVA